MMFVHYLIPGNNKSSLQRQDGTARPERRQLAAHGSGDFARFRNLHLFGGQPIYGFRLCSRHTR